MCGERSRRERGFTLIELLIVVGIIGILIGVMVPTLLQARTPAQDRQAQNLLRNSLTAAKTIETSDGLTPTEAMLQTAEIGVQFHPEATSATASERGVSVAIGGLGGSWYLIFASHASSGRCFAVLEQPDTKPMFQRVDDAASCRADDFDTVTGWQDSWP
jgi:prepilin-type N-terminal cleavage/methylation domain-containing protein